MGERGTQNSFSSPLCMCKPLAENPPAPSWLSTSLARSPGHSGTGWALGYLSYTTFLQLRTTVIPDTVAMVAWTVDTSLKRRESKGVTPNVTPQGPRHRESRRHLTPTPCTPQRLVTARGGCARRCLPGESCQVPSLPPPWVSGNAAGSPWAQGELHRREHPRLDNGTTVRGSGRAGLG